MHFDKRYIILVILALIVAMPSFGQRFTKKEQALREARAINYFYGNSFTISAGYVHGWLCKDEFTDSNTFGKTGAFCNNRPSFSSFFAWDYCKKKTCGFQVEAGYAQFGGEKIFYIDQGLGYGPQQRYDLTEKIRINEVMLQFKYRYFIPLTYESRISLNVGPYVGYVVGTYDDNTKWDFGPVVGAGYDWKHWSFGVDYLPGVWSNIVKGSSTRVGALMFNVGVHLWK